MSGGRRLAVLGGRLVLGIATTLAIVALGLVALGWRPVVLVSGSMSPWAEVGDLVLAAPVAGEEVAVGDVVTVLWRGSSSPVTHRVVALERGEGGAVFAITQGDANASPDVAVTRLDGELLLRARTVLPGAGAVFTSRWTMVALGVGAAVAGVVGLLRLWLPVARGSRPARGRVVGL